MRQYLDLLDHVLTTGVDKADRTGTGTRSVFGYQMRFDLAEGFPVVTTKKLHLRSIIGELLWFLRGDTNVRWLQERGISIWDEWADDERRPRPGLRPPVALVADAGRARTSTRSPRCIESIRTNPDSRRHIVSAWNVADVDADGPAAVPHDVPVLRRPPTTAGDLVLPALPALRRHLPRRAVQHRLLRAADADGGAGHAACAPASSSTPSATPTSTSTTSSRPDCS